MLELIKQPWPWYVAGPLIGLMVPTLLILGNKSFGISSSLRHLCAVCVPSKIPFFHYDWRKEAWNLFFVAGIVLGGVLAVHYLYEASPLTIHPDLAAELSGYGITNLSSMVPTELVNWESLMTLPGLIMLVGGGFLIGFGSRYAGGCTSGHSIMGLSTLQWPSLIATLCFMIGGFIMANWILPLILTL
ncbi:YeeE/YedE family protein [Larkinella bovis]|uniref:YeeE/YedE family protein n=1 Tax=Larkinella bovis TaxID=683041 RepID=A0ABW0IG94_9BACT